MRRVVGILPGRQENGHQAAVTWGFNSRESLAASEPDYLFDQPVDFLRLLTEL